ncbi:nuclear transport factor 2 family protein [Gordonia sp. HY442]|uniref:nuclear transport factor 2 family protein n=1 Tax=Gordonia zhenghanii TaxID=2911516 RepID=UPI001F1B67A1|nr:nuclear transport factor 2 family protein [Gordonia zhenghanii]MCF8604244.1 nuclear transport factor 2 family protein [Gordonia zhenghanii]
MPNIADALHDLLNEHETPLDEAVSRHFTENYRQRTDGDWDDRAGFVQHIAHLRSIVSNVEISILDELQTTNRYADHHIAHITKRDGTEVLQEVYLFGHVADDGRLEQVEEVTMMLRGAEGDRAIGSAH